MLHFSQLNNIKWDIYRISNKHKEINNIMCFDIEVSSFFKHQNKIYSQNDILKKFEKLEKNERYNVLSNFFSDCEKGSICYIWQFGIENNEKFETYYGRELYEFKILLDKINSEINYPAYIYIHNSAYEMQFLRNILDLENECEYFFTDIRKPLYFRYGNIEFRCSYRLTNLSLRSWAHQSNETQKTILDYGVIRTPKTKLTKSELKYCENDILIMYDGLKKYREQYKYLGNIVYTQTGKPRRELKQLFHNNKNYHNQITKELPTNSEEYKIQKRCYGGGLTICNAIQVKDKKTDKIKIHNDVYSMDIASAYPFQIVSQKFPCGKFRKCNKKFDDLNFKKYAYLLCIKIENKNSNDKTPLIKAKTIKHILPRSKLKIRKGCNFDNGKLIDVSSDGYIVFYCTEIDFMTYQKFYDFNITNVELLECWEAPKSYLNKDFVEYVLKLYANKTTLKGIEEEKEYYQRLKEILNACYGMACTSLIFEPIELINGEFKNAYAELSEEKITEIENEKLLDIQCKPYKNIVAFSMGIYITSYQRANICNMLLKIKDNDFLYTDTDSIKYLNGDSYENIFKKENENIIKLLKKVSKERNINIDFFMPKDKNGKVHAIGLWECEENYKQACFAGAKRYCYIDQHDNFHLTISGVPKCASVHTTITDFQDGFIFDDKICERKKNIVTYIDGNNLVGETLNKNKYDEFIVNEKYGINMYPTGYRMSLEKDYVYYISQLLKRKRIK